MFGLPDIVKIDVVGRGRRNCRKPFLPLVLTKKKVRGVWRSKSEAKCGK